MTVQQPRGTTMSPSSRSGDTLADILERVLDKGIVIAGDIQVNVLDIELLTLKLRLLVASVDTARDMGIDWWSRDPFLTGESALQRENKELADRLERLERATGRSADSVESADRDRSVQSTDRDRSVESADRDR